MNKSVHYYAQLIDLLNDKLLKVTQENIQYKADEAERRRYQAGFMHDIEVGDETRAFNAAWRIMSVNRATQTITLEAIT